MNFFQWHIGDYRSHTSHLSLEEDMAYRRLLELYYLHEGPINGRSTDVQQSLNDVATDVARLINMRDHISAVSTVLKEFFVFMPDEGWRNKRADKEISRYLKKTKQASKAGKRSAEIRGQRTFNGRSTDVQRNVNGRSTTMTMTMTKKEDTSDTQFNPETFGATKIARASRLPADWVPSDKLALWFKSERPDLNLQATLDHFRDYWLSRGAGGAKLDWDRTFKNWTRNQRAVNGFANGAPRKPKFIQPG